MRRFVYYAHGVKRMLGDTTVYDDSTACIGVGSRLAHKSNQDSDHFIQVFSNPVNESCTFRFHLGNDQAGRIEFNNLLNEMIDI